MEYTIFKIAIKPDNSPISAVFNPLFFNRNTVLQFYRRSSLSLEEFQKHAETVHNIHETLFNPTVFYKTSFIFVYLTSSFGKKFDFFLLLRYNESSDN